jgi:hypothetical protein
MHTYKSQLNLIHSLNHLLLPFLTGLFGRIGLLGPNGPLGAGTALAGYLGQLVFFFLLRKDEFFL